MKNNQLLNIERLLGKIDNDFNIDNSDWIPRVAAWVIDALSQLKCLPKEVRERELPVEGRIAIIPCTINLDSLKVFDEYGCEIPRATTQSCCGRNQRVITEQIGVSQVSDDERERVIVANIINPTGKNYVITGCDKIELNFDANYITIKSEEVKQYHSELYNCDVPYIFDDGILLEALEFYCLYKMLGRGYKHQVYSLNGNEATNPYIQWKLLKDNAIASVTIKLRRLYGKDGWNNFFFNSTFLPRNN